MMGTNEIVGTVEAVEVGIGKNAEIASVELDEMKSWYFRGNE